MGPGVGGKHPRGGEGVSSEGGGGRTARCGGSWHSGGGHEHREDLAEQVEQGPVGQVGQAPEQDTLGASLVEGGPEQTHPRGAVALEAVVGEHGDPVAGAGQPDQGEQGQQGQGEAPHPRRGGGEERPDPAEGRERGGRGGDVSGVLSRGHGGRPGELGLATARGGAAAGHTAREHEGLTLGVYACSVSGGCWPAGRGAAILRRCHRGENGGFPNAVKTADGPDAVRTPDFRTR